MPTLTIRKRLTGKGEPRYDVAYRLGGRAYPIKHAGTFKTLREAKLRRDFVAGELSAGRNPAVALEQNRQPRAKPSTIATYFETWKASRVDLDSRTLANCDAHWRRLAPSFATLTVDEITFALVQEWIAANGDGERGLTPGGLRNYVGTLKQILDFAGVEPNPARDRRIRYPTAEREIPIPPSDKHVLAMLDQMAPERRLLYIFLEQDGGRIGEHVAFTWGDVDVEGERILARPDVVKGRRGSRKARWLQIPDWLMGVLLDSCPPEDRTATTPLFPWVHAVEHPRQAANRTMRDACKAAGIPHYHPHDLRHRRLSLWHGQGIPAREIGERAGQRQIATTLDVYTHVMPLDEVPSSVFLELLAPPTP
jgi:integrase